MSKSIEFACEVCGNNEVMDDRMITLRKHYIGDLICKKCYKTKIPKTTPVKKEHYPERLWDLLDSEIWEYEKIEPYLDVLKTKKQILFTCVCCGNKDKMEFNSMKRRKIVGTKPICRKCSLKFATNSEEWRTSNSKAQFVSQNKEEVKEKQRIAQEKNMKEDPFYVDKRRSKTYLSGKINEIYFDSSWELFYIVHCLENPLVSNIERYRSRIPYFDKSGKKRWYFPDFEVSMVSGQKKVVEIKGNNCRNVEQKKQAAISHLTVGYEILKQKDLHEIGLFVRSEPFIREWYTKIFKNYKIEFNDTECFRRWYDKLKKLSGGCI